MNEDNDLVKSDFAQLIIARKLIKQLQFENGILQSERDEMKHTISTMVLPTENLTKEELKEVKKDKLLNQAKEENSKLKKKITELRNANEQLIIKNLALQRQLNFPD